MGRLKGRGKHVPTDIEILGIIYNSYYDEFSSFTKETPTRSAKIYVPIGIRAISKN